MCEKHIHRMPEVSYERLIRVGLVGPKLRPRGVSDGEQVNIPVPPLQRQRGDAEGYIERTYWTWCVAHLRQCRSR